MDIGNLNEKGLREYVKELEERNIKERGELDVRYEEWVSDHDRFSYLVGKALPIIALSLLLVLPFGIMLYLASTSCV